MESYLIQWLPADNYLFSILSNSKTHYEKFVMENYIDIKCDMKFDYAINTFLQMYNYNDFGCFDILQFRMDLTNRHSENISKIITKSIDSGYNLLVPIDTYYVSDYPASKQNHISHEIYIYEYDEMFYIAKDFFDFKKYENRKCMRNEIEEAILNYDMVEHVAPNYNVVGLKLMNRSNLEEINLRKFYNSLNNFIGWDKPVNKAYFGISWFDGIIEDLKNERYKDFRILEFHFLYEHIKLMILRLDYLVEINDVSLLHVLLNDFKNFIDEVNRKKYCLMKLGYRTSWTAQEDIKIRKSTIEDFKDIKDKYGVLLLRLIKIVKRYLG